MFLWTNCTYSYTMDVIMYFEVYGTDICDIYTVNVDFSECDLIELSTPYSLHRWNGFMDVE